ncbi:MAG TPA: NAD-dependent epimerase/dehydratase family protein [Actinomycetota bacterium]|nr:NAD-dependent epimerase/dehydratase family protein [Actinomycetota bacterium]
MGQRVLITGIAGHLAGRLAQRLESDPDVDYVVGLDLHEPTLDLERTEYVRADIRNPLVLKVLQTTEVDTLVHLSILSTPGNVGGRSGMKELNIIGTMQLLGACQRAERIAKVVVKSTTAVYGAGPKDPAVFTEEMSARSDAQHGYMKDAVEIERYVRGFARRRRDVAVTTLRFANFMGPDIATPLTRYLSLPVVPTALGYDPRLQFVHEDDAVEVFYRSVREDHPGVYNVAGDGVVLLSQALRLIGKPSVPVVLPLVQPVASVLRRVGAVDFATDQLRFLLFGRVADNARLKRDFGYQPRFDARGALLEFARGRRLRRLVSAEQISDWEKDVYAFLRRKGQERFERTRGT